MVAALAAATLGAFVAGRVTAAQADRTWSRYDGRDWTLFEPREKRAFVSGFLAGSALADAGHAGATDSAALHRAVDSLFRGGGLTFPFAHVVYATQLDDFYWWENHIPVPLYLALRDVNGRLKRQER
ncbi:MAG: hypothetical protein ACREMJ_01540 [Gemmatimonadales bacterium]